jgi:hypothetical protein
VGSLERYAKRDVGSIVGFSIKYLLVVLLLFWPLAVVHDNIHHAVWEWVAGVPF